MEVTKIVNFCGGHRLSNYNGLCSMIHGHNYVVEATIISDILNDIGFVIDFKDLKRYLNEVIEKLDHKTILKTGDKINEDIAAVVPKDWIVWFEVNPTAENISKFIYNSLKPNLSINQKLKIKVYETDTSFAEYTE